MITNKVQKKLLEIAGAVSFFSSVSLQNSAKAVNIQFASELRNDELLRLRLPIQIVPRLKRGFQIADHFECVTIFQVDGDGS